MILTINIDQETKPTVNFAPESTLDEIIQNVQNIFKQVKGTIPYQRDMGFDEDIIDLPVQSAIMLYQISMLKQVKRYEPRVQIKGFDWSGSDLVNGNLNLKLIIYINEGDL